MKSSVLNNQHDEADKFLEDFKKEHKEMLSDKEVINEFVKFTVPENKAKDFIK